MDVREKLVKQAISHFWYGVSHDIFSEPVTTYAKLAIEALEKEKESGVTVQEWISVDDRLPDDNDRVIAFRPNEPEISAYKYCVMWGWSVKASLKHRGITHWCKMPQPPKENDYDKMQI